MLAAVALTACLPCHAAIVEAYAKTGMARSFYRLSGAQKIEDFAPGSGFFHQSSSTRFEWKQRAGALWLATDSQGYSAEREVQYGLGSGRHARSYVHLTPQGRLRAMPISWYTRPGGGFWQMAPGFDRPDHPGFRRPIGYDCFFCHSGYPDLPARADEADPVYQLPLPEGIDCTRCHGSAREHLTAPRKGTIFNPARLPPQRQIEVCLQCHLETTSQPLPFAIRRFGRRIFSYDPAEPLSDYTIHFDHENRAPWNEKFEVVSAPYRLMQSACYRKSAGRITCLTCHDPHGQASRHQDACRACHSAAHTGQPEARQSCAGCHMPARAPEDAPLTRITDHKIARRPDTRPGVTLPEYTGRIRIFWPPDADYPAYEALVNRSPSLLRNPPAEPEALVFLGHALRSVPMFEAALRRPPGSLSAWRGLVLLKFPDLAVTRKALAAWPGDPFLLTVHGEALHRGGKLEEAAQVLKDAIAADADQPEPWVNLGAVLAELGRRDDAARMFRSALALDPRNRAAAENLKRLTRPGNSSPRPQ